MCITRVIAITGCDCGLGWALAARSAREGLITVAGMFNGTDTKAAKALKEFSALPLPLDVTRSESIEDFKGFVDRLLKENPSYRLYAVINNAGVMAIGDFEWQTPQIIEYTIDVNLMGTMRVIKGFLPDLRKTAMEKSLNPRIINVASHCGLQPLPGFGPYSASKAAVLALTKSLRYELGGFGVSSVAFIPGGFIGASNLMSKQIENTEEMLKNLNEEQKSFYSQRLKALSNYLRPVATENRHDTLKQESIIGTFMKALTDEKPKKLYKVESWRYKFYYNLMKLPLPESAHNWLIKKFINFPKN